MFRVDPYYPTVKTLDLSMRFFKGSVKGMNQTPRNRTKISESIIGTDPQYYEYYKNLRSYDDE